jgi:hypothetical protein
MRTFLIGDIHGCCAELLDLLDKAGLSGDDRIIALGDIVDRGPETPQVLEFFQNRPGCYRITFTRYGHYLNRTIIIPCAGKRSKGNLPKGIWPKLGREKAEVYPGKNGEKQGSGRGGFGSMRSAMMMTWAGMSILSISIR